MIKKIVICDRCKEQVGEHTHSLLDKFGNRNIRTIEINSDEIFFCDDCYIQFEKFISNKIRFEYDSENDCEYCIHRNKAADDLPCVRCQHCYANRFEKGDPDE